MTQNGLKWILNITFNPNSEKYHKFCVLSFEGFPNFASVTLPNISQCTIGSQTRIMYFSCLSSKSAADGAKVAGKVLANKFCAGRRPPWHLPAANMT